MTTGSTELDTQVARYVARGYAVESRTASQLVLVKPRRIGWFWNTILVLVTGGLWLIYVIYRVVNRKADRVVFTLGSDDKVRRS